jgi:hypothetical protein
MTSCLVIVVQVDDAQTTAKSDCLYSLEEVNYFFLSLV